jgi:hypothetical protein
MGPAPKKGTVQQEQQKYSNSGKIILKTEWGPRLKKGTDQQE